MTAAAAPALGLVISAAAGTRGHQHALGLARAAQKAGVAVRAVILTQPAAGVQDSLRSAGATCLPPEQLAAIVADAGRVLHFT